MDSLRIVPGRETKPATVQDTSNSFGLHDALKYGPRSLAAEVTKMSTVRDRLENWEATQDNMKLQMQRQLFGLHMPMRILMERKIVSQNPHMPILPQSNLHLDILMGRDEVLDCADFMGSAAEMVQPMDIHADMEKKLRM
ncbi:proteasome maturation factor UMP1 [Dichomitus squalens LYAD-421 SS1]|uniref:Proteasome maturation factor UMP1 n=1 Tax=Dichomitus squalens (strain LYAD-421) TaxID=732165 RepID=R7SM69_DICSQ|nr:proteasome maturation factor UMP1 [Dichomitus squalens LYAD-421 SS1]EJF56117.1 proteasome maturation factor UMP1 [Dichomitus squalens LYAD-421 SS1]